MRLHVNFGALSRARLASVARASADVLEALRALGNPVAQVLAHQGKFIEMDHYPKGDVYDAESASQYSTPTALRLASTAISIPS
jgi:hypothetical protein